MLSKNMSLDIGKIKTSTTHIYPPQETTYEELPILNLIRVCKLPKATVRKSARPTFILGITQLTLVEVQLG